MSTAELYDYLQTMFGLGEWTETSDVPWYRVRMNEIGKLKRMLRSRQVTEDNLYQAALYAQANDIPVVGYWRLFELVRPARAAAATHPKTDRLQAAIDEAWANGDSTWAYHLNNVHRNDTVAVERALKEYERR